MTLLNAVQRHSTDSFRLLLLAVAIAMTNGCSIRKMAVNKLGDALAGGGTTFASDDDPELVKAAVPFSLKLMESLLAESPEHQGLLFATASGFTQYAYAFVQQEADETEDDDFEAAQVMRARARRLYLRARNYGFRALDAAHRGFSKTLQTDAAAALKPMRREDVRVLYWTGISWAAAISISKDDPELIADLPLVEALIDRAFALDPDFDNGAIHSFLITYEMARQDAEGDASVRAKRHFDRAVELTNRLAAGPFVSYAESVLVTTKDAAGFEAMLNQALAIDADAKPEWRLANLIMQRRARWLLEKKDELFLISN